MYNENIVAILENEIPEFLQEEYPQFVKFIKTYYEWLETADETRDDNFIRILLDHTANNDIFESKKYIDDKMIGLGFPNSSKLKIPAEHFITMLREFYTMRGNVDSFKFLFRAFYDEDIEIGFPREYLTGSSSTKWGKTSEIYVTLTNENAYDYKVITEPENHSSITIRGLTSGLEAQCEQIFFIESAGARFMKLIISDTFGSFINREPIKMTFDQYSITESLVICNDLEITNSGLNYMVGDIFEILSDSAIMLGSYSVSEVYNGSISSIQIISGGTGYKIGDPIYAEKSQQGAGFYGEVTNVDANGTINAVRVSNKGWNYTSLPNLTIKSNGSGAEINAVSNTIGKIKKITTSAPTVSVDVLSSYTIKSLTETGTGATFALKASPIFTSQKHNKIKSKGLLGGTNIITDSNFFQHFSYEIKSQIPKDEHSHITNQCHPTGTVQFNKMDVNAKIQLPSMTMNVVVETT